MYIILVIKNNFIDVIQFSYIYYLDIILPRIFYLFRGRHPERTRVFIAKYHNIMFRRRCKVESKLLIYYSTWKIPLLGSLLFFMILYTAVASLERTTRGELKYDTYYIFSDQTKIVYNYFIPRAFVFIEYQVT